jgi:hypothetical protein
MVRQTAIGFTPVPQHFGVICRSSPGGADARLKTNITPLTHVLEKLEQLCGVLFAWNDAAAPLTGPIPERRNFGVIAQGVEAVFPELITSGGG